MTLSGVIAMQEEKAAMALAMQKAEALEGKMEEALAHMKSIDESSQKLVGGLEYNNVKMNYCERRYGWSHNWGNVKTREVENEMLKFEAAMVEAAWTMNFEDKAVKPFWKEEQASVTARDGSYIC